MLKPKRVRRSTFVLPDKTATLKLARRVASQQGCTARVAGRVAVRLASPNLQVLDGRKSKKMILDLIRRRIHARGDSPRRSR